MGQDWRDRGLSSWSFDPVIENCNAIARILPERSESQRARQEFLVGLIHQNHLDYFGAPVIIRLAASPCYRYPGPGQYLRGLLFGAPDYRGVEIAALNEHGKIGLALRHRASRRRRNRQ